jgi:hypothetical protein
MVDSSQTDTFDDWFLNTNEPTISDANQSSPTSLPSSPISSSNESSLSVTKNSSVSNNNEENQIKKRKNEQKTDSNEHKKVKQAPPYMRRNIRHLLTNDKLQDGTLTALKAEQDRLKRLEEINENQQQYNTIYTHLLADNSNQYKQIPNEQECIILDDDENEQESLSTFKINSGSFLNCKISRDVQRQTASRLFSLDRQKYLLHYIKQRKKHQNFKLYSCIGLNKQPTDLDNDDDGSDSDVQYVDGDNEMVNENLTKKLQRLHVDDRINIPDENGKIHLSKKLKSPIHLIFR